MVKAAYIHVPFCVHRCGYCDFTVIAKRDDLLDVFLDCLEQEISSQLQQPHPVETLFIGGGTPNYLPADQLMRLLTILHTWLPVPERDGEYSIECNPELMTGDRMDLLVEFGVNRVSLGIQSFQQEHLETLERGHSPEMVATVVNDLRDRGCRNVSFDLIYAVPGQSLDEWNETLNDAVKLNPEHISTYGLTFEKGTSFWTRRQKSLLQPVDEELERSMYADAMQRLTMAGFEQYELSNHARSGFRCRHNQVYWNAEYYFGFGPGAASYVPITNQTQLQDAFGFRRLNDRSVTRWIKRIQSGESAIGDSEVITKDLAAREAVMLGLRQTAGINLLHYEKKYGVLPADLAPQAFEQFMASEHLQISDNHLRLTHAGRFIADTIVAEFL